MTTSNAEETTRPPQHAQISGVRQPMLGMPLTRCRYLR